MTCHGHMSTLWRSATMMETIWSSAASSWLVTLHKSDQYPRLHHRETPWSYEWQTSVSGSGWTEREVCVTSFVSAWCSGNQTWSLSTTWQFRMMSSAQCVRPPGLDTTVQTACCRLYQSQTNDDGPRVLGQTQTDDVKSCRMAKTGKIRTEGRPWSPRAFYFIS